MANIKVVQPTSVKVSTDGTITSSTMLNIATSAAVVAMNDGQSVQDKIDSMVTDINGKAPTVHTHTVSQITDFPESIKNPNALTINGQAYDGSSAVTLSLATESHTHNYAGSTTAGGAANKVANALTISLNGTPQTAFDGSAKVAFDITPDAIGALAEDAAATSVANALTISLNGVSQGEYDGSAAKAIDVTPAAIGAATESHTHTAADLTGTIPASKIDGVLSLENIPAAAVERLTVVENEAAMLALTSDTVQVGDTVKLADTGKMYYVKDAAKLGTLDAFEEYTVGSAASVPWSGVTGKPSTFTPSAHTHTVSEITDFPTSLKNPNALTIKLNGTSQGAYDGSAVKEIDITATSVGAYTTAEIDAKIETLEQAVTNSKLAAWPIGSVFIGVDNTIIPNTLLGGGTWEAIGEVAAAVGSTTYLMKYWKRTA